MSPAFPLMKSDVEFEIPASRPWPEFTFIDVAQDPDTPAVWATTRRSAPVSYSLPLLADLLALGEHVEHLGREAPEFLVYRSGHPSIFSLGGHLSYFSSCIEQSDLAGLEDYALRAVDAIWMAMTGCGAPHTTTISLVEGEAQGGGFEAALATHLLAAEEGTKFGFPEALFGLFPGMGGLELLKARGGAELVESLVSGARKVAAEELYELGVVDFLAKPKKGAALVRDLCANGSTSLAQSARSRFSGIKKSQLIETTMNWARQAAELPKRDLKTISYLSQMQERFMRRSPTVRAL